MADTRSAIDEVPPLTGLRVLDLSSWIAGAYCCRLLADGGAEIVKAERPGGDPLRRWSASGAEIAADADGPLLNHLAASVRSVLLDDDQATTLDALLADAHAVVWSRGRPDQPQPGWRTPTAILAQHPHLVVAAITPFGLDVEWADRPASEFTLQAWSGGIIRLARSRPDRVPTAVGGQVGEWMAGLHAAIGTLAAWRAGGDGHLVDVSMLECLAATLTYHPVTFFEQLERPIRVDRFVPTPGVAAAADGMVGLGTGTGQQWLDFCAMVGRPDWAEDRSYLLDRTALAPEIDAWVADHTVDEICELATAFRLPNAPIVHGANAPEIEHLRVRKTFAPNPRDGALGPRPPWRSDEMSDAPRRPAPVLGSTPATGAWSVPGAAPARPAARQLPFAGLTVLDMTSFWAGPLTGHHLAMLGAEVWHLEAPDRPDGARLVGGVSPTEEHHLERSPIFAALNTNKKSVAIDTRTERGGQLLRRLIAECDVFVENYTPRVLDQLGLDGATLREVNPGLITVRMPGFGLDGPWRDVSAFAFVIEDASGLTWGSGHPDALPIEPYSIGDPNAGLHALFGLQLALARRDATGEGCLVEAAMVDAAVSIAAEQMIEYSAQGALLHRTGNRGPLAAPQGVYPVDGLDPYGQEDNWVAIAVANDEQWQALVRVLGAPAWAADPNLATAAGRREHHDLIDEQLTAWCRERSAEDVVDRLWSAGVAVAPVVHPHHQVDLPPMQQRRFFEVVDHPVTGPAHCATLPFGPAHRPDRYHLRHAPLLGEHTTEVLRSIGVTDDEIEALQAERVAGP